MPDKTIPNQEWELHELIESLSAEFDRFQDTLHLKSYARGVSFGLTTTHFELSVFARYDPKLKKWLFRTALPGESGTSVMKLDIPYMLRDQVQTHEPGFETKPDTRPIKDLGFSMVEVGRLNRLSIFNVNNLQKMAISSEMRQSIANMTDIKPDRIAGVLNIPEVWYVQVENDVITITGSNLTMAPDKSVLIADYVAEVLDSSPNRITARLPKGVVAGEVVVTSSAGTSRFMSFDRKVPTGTASLEGQPGLNKQYINMLKAAGIRTVAEFLKQPVEKLAKTMKISDTKAMTIIETVAAQTRKKPGTSYTKTD